MLFKFSCLFIMFIMSSSCSCMFTFNFVLEARFVGSVFLANHYSYTVAFKLHSAMFSSFCISIFLYCYSHDMLYAIITTIWPHDHQSAVNTKIFDYVCIFSLIKCGCHKQFDQKGRILFISPIYYFCTAWTNVYWESRISLKVHLLPSIFLSTSKTFKNYIFQWVFFWIRKRTADYYWQHCWHQVSHCDLTHCIKRQSKMCRLDIWCLEILYFLHLARNVTFFSLVQLFCVIVVSNSLLVNSFYLYFCV